MKSKFDMEARRDQVIELLRPDALRNHRVSEGLELDEGQRNELREIAHTTASMVDGLHQLSVLAMEADPKDKVFAKVRNFLKLEAQFQARLRGEPTSLLRPPTITKIDIVLSEKGMQVVEIEPGKVRGLGYGAMVRQQHPSQELSVGVNSLLDTLSGEEPAVFILSEKDRFHEPEISVLSQLDMRALSVSQKDIDLEKNGIRIPHKAILAKNAILLSKLVNRGVTDEKLEQTLNIISGRRPDMEAKTVLALLHNIDTDPELETLLAETIGVDVLEDIRRRTPVTFHAQQLNHSKRDETVEKIADGTVRLFLKPVTDSGTRGIVTPDETGAIANLLRKPKTLKNFVAQEALSIVFRSMVSQDVLRGDIREDTVNTRITLHVDTHGSIIEASAVCSPDNYLAHGGVSSIITSVE